MEEHIEIGETYALCYIRFWSI